MGSNVTSIFYEEVLLNEKTVSKIKILHVDDDPCLLEAAKQILEMEGDFEVETALSVDEAFDKLDKQSFDVVISDHEMPQKNGLQFLKELREQKNDIPFIMFTGKGREEVAIQALNLGADHYVSKNGSTEMVYYELAHNIISSVEKKRAEHQSLYDALLFQNVTDPILATDNHRVVTAWNLAAENLFGWKATEVKGKSVQEVFSQVQIEPAFTKIIETLNATGSFQGEILRKNKAGVPINIELSIVSLQNKLGKFIGNVAVYHDITQRKKMENALKQERDKLESITAAIGAGLVIVSKNYHVLWANNFIKRYKGDTEGKLCYATLNSLDAPCPDCGVAKIFAGKTTLDAHEYCSTTIDGKPYWVEIVATPITDENGNLTSAAEIAVDITEKKLGQQKLQANEAKFRAITDSAIDAIFMFNEDDAITYWNPAAELIFGYTEKEIVGQKVNATLVPPRFRKDHLKLTSELGKIENTKKSAGEIREFPALRKDGTEFQMELSLAPLQLNGNRYFVAIVRDVNDRKKAEEILNQTMDQLVLVNEKLGVVGSLTRHDVRNKLCTVNGNAFLLKKKHPDQADIVDGLAKMEQAVKEIGRIFDFAKMYEQLGIEELTYSNVEKTLKEAIALFSDSFNLEVINDCHGLTLLADSLLRQLFYNLIDNSLKHGEKVTKIKVHYQKKDQDELIVVYEDDGVGISAMNKPRLFQEGFSTSGTSGYGLFLIKKMIDVYGWAIQESGVPGKGAKFTITIPKINQNGKENFKIS